jgi:hypothetical protein
MPSLQMTSIVSIISAHIGSASGCMSYNTAHLAVQHAGCVGHSQLRFRHLCVLLATKADRVLCLSLSSSLPARFASPLASSWGLSLLVSPLQRWSSINSDRAAIDRAAIEAEYAAEQPRLMMYHQLALKAAWRQSLCWLKLARSQGTGMLTQACTAAFS